MKKKKKIVDALSLLQKIENLSIRNLQSEMQELNSKMDSIEQKIQNCVKSLERERTFYLKNGALDYAAFSKRMNDEINHLKQEKNHVEKQFDQLLEKLREHASNEKSYDLLRKKNVKIINKEELKKQEDIIADIINNKFIDNEENESQ